MCTILLQTISRFMELTNDDVYHVKTFFKPLNAKNGTVLIGKNEFARNIYFINSGHLRYFNISERGEEQTIHLFSPGEFATSFCGFVNNTKSEEILHTITDSELLFINKDDLEKLFSLELKWQIFGRKLMEYHLLEKEIRIINQISLSAKERYLRLLETNSILIKNVPMQYIASYIGIKPESLSRIRKQLFLTNVK